MTDKTNIFQDFWWVYLTIFETTINVNGVNYFGYRSRYTTIIKTTPYTLLYSIKSFSKMDKFQYSFFTF